MIVTVHRLTKCLAILSSSCFITSALEALCTERSHQQEISSDLSDDHFSLLQRPILTKLHSTLQRSAKERASHRLPPSVAAPPEELMSTPDATAGWMEIESGPLQNSEVRNTGQAPELLTGSVKKSNSRNETNTTHSGNFWSGLNGNLASTGASPYAVSKDFTGGPTWNVTVTHWLLPSKVVVGTPLIDSLRNIYLTTTYGKVLKFDVDGASVWNQSVGGNVNVTPAISEGFLHLATEAGEAVALDMATGNVTWRRKLSKCQAPSARAVMASTGVVFHALHYADEDCAFRTYINALDAKHGKELWTYSPFNFVGKRGPPVGLFAIEGAFIVFTDIEGNVCKLELESGKESWGHDTQVLVATNGFLDENVTEATANSSQSPNESIDDTLAVEGLLKHRTLALNQGHDVLDESAGKEFEIARRGSGAVVGPGEVVFVTSNPISDHGARRGRLEALNFTTGKLLWQVNLGHAIRTGPVVGQLHPGGKGNFSVLLTVGNMSPNSSSHAGVRPARRLYSRKVLTFEALTGAAQNWTYEEAPWSDDGECSTGQMQAFSNPAIGGDGTVYLGSGNGMLYAIRDHDGDGFVNETKEVSSYAAGHAFIASPAIAPGLLVAAPCNGMVVFKQF